MNDSLAPPGAPSTDDHGAQPPLSAGGSAQREGTDSLFEEEEAVENDSGHAQQPAPTPAGAAPEATSDQLNYNPTGEAKTATQAALQGPGTASQGTVLSSKPLSRGTKSISDLPGISIPALCSPAMFIDLPTVDSLANLITKHIPPHMRPTRDLTGRWPQGEVPNLPLAIQTNSWRRVAQSARSRIIAFGATMAEGRGGTAEVLAWWDIRIHALWRLRLTGHVSRELGALWHVLEETVISVKSGPQGPISRYLIDSPLIPFSLWVMYAKEPRLRGNILLALERVMVLLRKCETTAVRFEAAEKIASTERNREACSAALSMWKDRAIRLKLIVASLLVDISDYSGAKEFLRPLIDEAKERGDEDAAFLSCIARLHLHAGLVDDAAEVFTAAEQAADAELARSGEQLHLDAPLAPQSTEEGWFRSRAGQLRALIATNRSLLSIANGDFTGARDALQTVLTGDWRSLAGNNQVDLATQLNNLAVALFYLGHLVDPVQVLEGLLQEAPSAVTATEPLMFNLATFYELGRDDSISDKRKMLFEVARWAGEGHSTSALKLS